MIDAYRIDGCTPAAELPFRVKIEGELLRDDKGGTAKFRTLAAAVKAGYAAAEAETRAALKMEG